MKFLALASTAAAISIRQTGEQSTDGTTSPPPQPDFDLFDLIEADFPVDGNDGNNLNNLFSEIRNEFNGHVDRHPELQG